MKLYSYSIYSHSDSFIIFASQISANIKRHIYQAFGIFALHQVLNIMNFRLVGHHIKLSNFINPSLKSMMVFRLQLWYYTDMMVAKSVIIILLMKSARRNINQSFALNASGMTVVGYSAVDKIILDGIRILFESFLQLI